MTLLQLEYFQALAENLHYTKTAEQLHISQPALSYTIRELENELGVKLFTTKNRRVFLTDYARCFLPYVDQILSLVREGSQAVKNMAENAPETVRIGYFHSISTSLIPTLVGSFSSSGKDGDKISFQFTETSSFDVLARLKSGQLDLGFSLHRADWAEAVPIMRQPLYLCVPSGHPLAKKGEVSFPEFAREPQIMMETGSNVRENMDALYAANGITPNIVFEVQECSTALKYVGLGFGVSVLAGIDDIDRNRVAVLPIADRDRRFVRTVYLSYPKKRPLSRAARAVLDYIREQHSPEEFPESRGA